MRLLYLQAKVNGSIKIPDSELAKLPSKIGLVASIQHIDELPKLKKRIKKAVIGGQVLGCRVDSAEKIASKVDGFLFVGSGEFHPIGIAIATGKPVYILDPLSPKKGLQKLSPERIERFLKKKKAAMLKFLHAKSVGLIISTKNGQRNIKHAIALKELLDKNSKETYLFLCDTLEFDQLANFPFIDCWVNAACPRIADERSDMINAEDVLKLLTSNQTLSF
ncbi:MAG: diphthamide synthesis protein [Candidatus Woesearchaeota archaeon]